MSTALPEDTPALREALVAEVRELSRLGLNRGSTGNASLRCTRGGESGFLVTATGLGAEQGADDLVWMSADGTQRRGRLAPSSEWPFHAAILATRPDLNAVLHTHSPHATAVACLRERLPAFHYMVAIAGGDDVPLVDYHLFGTEALSQAVAAAFATRNAALLSNHGLVAAGRDFAQAHKVLAEVEALCGIWLAARAVGAPALLDAAQMAAVIEKFRTYGQSQPGTASG
jgi:L-fuculose-phosphate aldolase